MKNLLNGLLNVFAENRMASSTPTESKQPLYINPCDNGALPFFRFNQGSAMNLSTAYRCIELISDSIGTLPVQVKRLGRRGKTNVLDNHPLVKIIYDKRNRITKFMLFKLIVQAVITKGNSFVYIQRAQERGRSTQGTTHEDSIEWCCRQVEEIC